MRKVAFWVLSLVLVGGVLVTGGVHKSSYSLMELAVFTVFLLLLLQQTKRRTIELPFAPVLAILILLLVIQIIPLPAGVIRLISPQRWENLSVLASSADNSWAPLSINPYVTRVAFLKILAYFAAFSLGGYLFDSRKRGTGIVLTLVGLGLLEALLGLGLYLGGWQDILPFASEFPSTRARGSYINPNHYAALLAMTSPFLFGWIYYLHGSGRNYVPARIPGRLAELRNAIPGQVPFYMFLLLVMLVSLTVSRSRMGIFSALSSFLLLVLLTQLKGRQTRLLVGSFLILGGVSAYLLWIGLDPVISRFTAVLDSGFVESNARILVWKDGLHLLRDYPLLGSGLGTFGIAFRAYQTTSVGLWFDQAHNDYLQFATELGVIGFFLLFGPIFWLMLRMIRSFLNDLNHYRASVTLGCIGGATALLVHSQCDGFQSANSRQRHDIRCDFGDRLQGVLRGT